MKFSFSTNAFVKYSVFEAVEKIAAIGYAGVELLADSPHLYADSTTKDDVHRLKKILDNTGISVANINSNTASGFYGVKLWEPLFEPSLAHPERSLRNWRIDYTKKCIDMARQLNSPGISITSGRPVSGIQPEKSLDLLRESLIILVEYASQSAIRVGIEYEPGLLVENHQELSALLKQIDSPFLGANLDLGHSHVSGENIDLVTADLASKIFHIHIEDIRGRKHYHLIPGTGDINFGELLGTLNRRRYSGFVTVELYTCINEPEAAAEQSLNYLQKMSAPEI